MSILVVAEHDNQKLMPGTFNTVTAARSLDKDVHVLIAGGDCARVAAQAATIEGAGSVLVADDPAYAHGLAENIAPLITGLTLNYSHILAPASFYGKNLMPRVAALLDIQPISDITAIVAPDTFIRPVYAGNALATIKSLDSPVILTVRGTAFDAAAAQGGNASVVEIESTGETGKTRFIKEDLSRDDRPALISAKIVVSGGRGVGSADAFCRLERLADKLGAALGASRAAVDAGFMPNDYQVGQTGKVVAPDLYIAVGISGAIQHMAGIKDSKLIVAINIDPDAPIFQIADYGLIMDWAEALAQLEQALES